RCRAQPGRGGGWLVIRPPHQLARPYHRSPMPAPPENEFSGYGLRGNLQLSPGGDRCGLVGFNRRLHVARQFIAGRSMLRPATIELSVPCGKLPTAGILACSARPPIRLLGQMTERIADVSHQPGMLAELGEDSLVELAKTDSTAFGELY